MWDGPIAAAQAAHVQSLCDAHSKCYANCRASQDYCDKRLRKPLQALCDEVNEAYEGGKGESSKGRPGGHVNLERCTIDGVYRWKTANHEFYTANKRHCRCVKG
jgi:hypothetical protein